MALIGAWTVALALAACGPAREASAPLGSRSYAATTPTVSAETSLAGPATGGVYSSCDAVASDGTNFVAACWKDRDAFTLPIRAADGTVGAGQLLWTLPPSAPGNPYGRTNSASRIALSGSKSDYVAAAVQWSEKHMGGVTSSSLFAWRVASSGAPLGSSPAYQTPWSPDSHYYSPDAASDGVNHVVAYSDFYSHTLSVVAATA